MQIYRGTDADRRAVTAISTQLDTIAASQDKILLLLPGGSAAKIAQAVLRDLSAATKSKLTLTLTDERFGAEGHADSNWNLYANSFSAMDALQLLPVLTKTDDQAATTTIWEAKLANALAAAGSVVALFGIGNDHHIAGIKPNSPPTWETERIVSSYQGEDYVRITISPVVFTHIQYGYIYAEGSSKLQAIETLAKDRDIQQYPDELIKRCGSSVVYYKA